MLPKHTPYNGNIHPFAIGLSPLNIASWIEVDEHLPVYLNEKHRLMREIPDEVWAQHGDTHASQQEVLDMLVEHLIQHFPQDYSLIDNGSSIAIAKSGTALNLEDAQISPLLKAAYLVQEDLVLLRKKTEGWYIAAASVCFPSSWILREKIGHVMHDVHAPVPEYGKGTRNASMIERIFDNLLTDQPVERFNWSVYNDPHLYHADRAGEHFPDEHKGEDDYFLRVEHQTLRKLPISGDILFGIRIHIDPMEVLSKRPDRSKLAKEFVSTIRSMNVDQLSYKGIEGKKEALINEIMKVAK